MEIAVLHKGRTISALIKAAAHRHVRHMIAECGKSDAITFHIGLHAMETKLINLIKGLDLPSLYRLRRLCVDTRDRLSFIGFRYNEEAPSIEDIEGIFRPLTRLFPDLKVPIGTEEVSLEIHQAYSAEETDRLQKEQRSVSDFDERSELVDRIFFRRKSTVNAVSANLIKIAKVAQDCIEGGDWEKLEKAQGFLNHFICCSDRFSFGNQEALIYLQTRGINCDDKIKELLLVWRDSAANVIKEFAHGHEIVHLDRTGDGKTERFGERPLEEAADVERWSTYLLRNFWSGHRIEELIIDATMLRTVEWCSIGGFDVWWKRWADYIADEIAHEGVDAETPSAIWLFSLCRSDFAIELLESTLGTALWALQLGKEQRHKPWTLFKFSQQGAIEEHCPLVAATILFCAERLGRSLCDPTVLSNAENFLPANQFSDGSWPFWCDDDQGSIEATAVAVHALALARPRGWKHAVGSAVDWLWAQQDPFGCWSERKADGSDVFLTVLVLDAIELASGGNKVSFDFNRCHKLERKGMPFKGYHDPNSIQTQRNIIMTNIDKRETHIHNSQVGMVGDVTAHNISESFNQAMEATTDEKLRIKLSELKNLVELLIKELPTVDAKTASRDFADLAQESTSPTPRKKRLEVTAEGLIEAASKCSRIVKPITDTVKEILDLFT